MMSNKTDKYDVWSLLIEILAEACVLCQNGGLTNQERYAYTVMLIELYYKGIIDVYLYAHCLQIFCFDAFLRFAKEGDFDEIEEEKRV